MTFAQERCHVQLALVTQRTGIMGDRPLALLAICYQQIKATLLEDFDEEGQPRVLFEVVFN